MPNYPISDHPLKGTTHIFKPNDKPYDGDTDTLPGRLIVGAGMTVIVKAVFHNWNDVPGLDMLYVFCTATGMHTHVIPADLGLTLTYERANCRHCERSIVNEGDGRWLDPEADGDDHIWMETCDSNHEDRIAAHEPATFFGACGVAECTDCLPRFDLNNREIPG